MPALVGAVLAAVAGLACFVLVTRYANGLRLGEDRAIAGGLFSGSLVALGLAHVIVDGLGPWWADHPMLAAGVSGALLLGLTVLLIDALVDRNRARQWSRTLFPPVWRQLRKLAVSGLSQTRVDLQAARWLSGESPQPWTDHTAAGLQSLSDAAQEVKAAVADIQPALLAGLAADL